MPQHFVLVRGLVVHALIVTTAALSLLGCSKDKGTTPKPPNNIIDEVDANVTDAGADLTLKNGMTVSIPAGMVSGSVHVVLSQISGDTNFTASFQTVLHFSADGPIGNARLVVPLDAGQDTALVGAAYMADQAKKLVYLGGVFSAANDTFSVSMTGTTASLAAGASEVASGAYVVTAGPAYTPVSISRILEIPYYQQDGGNCWAAAMLILMKSHKFSFAWDEIYEILHSTNIDKDDGYGWYSMGSMKSKCESMTGLVAEKNTWIKFANFVEYVFKCIDERKPVLVNLITHQGVICGYEIADPGPNETVSFYIHDPASWQSQTPYRKMTLDQIATEYWNQGVVGSMLNYFVTINFTTPLLASPDLGTIHLPNADSMSGGISSWQKGLAFAKGARIVDRARWDHRSATGYSFEGLHGIRADMDMIKLTKPFIWNMNRTDPAAVKIATTLYRDVDGTFKLPALVEKTQNATIAPASSYAYDVQIGLDEFVDDLTPADSLFGLQVELFNAHNQRVDDFDVVFEWHPLHIVSIDPDSGQAGDEVTISGMGFGKSQGASKVKFNGLEVESADIVSWANDEIVVNVPENASAGDITVEIGPAVSNGEPFAVGGGVLDVLHGTGSFLLLVDAIHTFGPSNYTSTYGMSMITSDVTWNGTSFEVSTTNPQGEQVTVSGHVSQNGRILEHIDALVTGHQPASEGVQGLTTVLHFVLEDIRLQSYDEPSYVDYELTVDGSTAGSHVTTMIKSAVWDDGTDALRYLSTDWNSTDVPPTLSVSFSPSF